MYDDRNFSINHILYFNNLRGGINGVVVTWVVAIAVFRPAGGSIPP